MGRALGAGRRSGDQFCVYVCDRLVLPTVRDRIDDIAAGGFSLDQATRDYVRGRAGLTDGPGDRRQRGAAN
jgi:hypothetical protein